MCGKRFWRKEVRVHDYRASYILTSDEIQCLLRAIGEERGPFPELDALLLADVTPETASHLLEKHLLRRNGDEIVAEPVAIWIARMLVDAESLAKVDAEHGCFWWIKCGAHSLVMQSYPHIESAWRVSPFPDDTAVEKNFGVKRSVTLFARRKA